MTEADRSPPIPAQHRRAVQEHDPLDRRVGAGVEDVEIRRTGPVSGPTALFVHGFLASDTLWDGVAERLAAAGIGSVLPTWPLGSHRRPAGPGELSPRSIAAAINDLCERLDLDSVVLVGNDTGGGLCQLALAQPSPRIRGLVLTNCDAFDTFPPRWFVPLFRMARYRPTTWFLLQNTRLRWLRHSPFGYGRLLNRPRPATTTRAWIEPALHDARIRRDINRFARALRGDELTDAASWLTRFPHPTRIVWGRNDGCFTIDLARRLAATLPAAQLVEVADATTFVPIDQPDAVAAAVRECVAAIGAPTDPVGAA